MNATQIIDLAEEKRAMVATAESCTGGMVAAALTDVAGSSAVVDRGFVTYSNAAKQDMLGVRAETLDAVGAVSEEVARAMAKGALAAGGEMAWEDIILIGAGEHKSFSGVNGKQADNKVLQLGLALNTKDGHAMDAASLGLQLLRRREPEGFDLLMGELL